jgi:hypothetical protein
VHKIFRYQAWPQYSSKRRAITEHGQALDECRMMIGVGDHVRLIAAANASDIWGPAIGSLGTVTGIHDVDHTGTPLALR